MHQLINCKYNSLETEQLTMGSHSIFLSCRETQSFACVIHQVDGHPPAHHDLSKHDRVRPTEKQLCTLRDEMKTMQTHYTANSAHQLQQWGTFIRGLSLEYRVHVYIAMTTTKMMTRLVMILV